MLRLRHKNLENLDPYLLKIIYACVGAHLLLLFFACFVQRDDALHINLAITPGARIVWVPSFMVPTQSTPRGTKKLSRSAPIPQPTKKNRQKSAAPIEQKKRLSKKGTTLRAAPKVIKKQKNKKIPEKKITPQNVPEALPETEVTAPQEVEQEIVAPQQGSDDQLDDVIYVNKDTYQMLEIAQQLQATISEHWSPPVGMSPGLVCQIRVTIDAHGKAIALEVVEKSGVAVFDMAARTALLASDYPPSVWNKTIVVDFNEEFL